MLLQGVQILLSISSSPVLNSLERMLIMIFTFRPCNRRAHYRKRRVPRFIVSLLLSLLCITAVVVLLLAPQWVLILIIAVLMFCICFISR